MEGILKRKESRLAYYTAQDQRFKQFDSSICDRPLPKRRSRPTL